MSIEVQTSERVDVVDVTSSVEDAVAGEARDGICTVYVPHTTAGVIVNEREERGSRSCSSIATGPDASATGDGRLGLIVLNAPFDFKREECEPIRENRRGDRRRASAAPKSPERTFHPHGTRPESVQRIDTCVGMIYRSGEHRRS